MSHVSIGWSETTIADVCEYISRGKSPKYVTVSSLPIVNQKAIRWHGIEAKHLKYVAKAQQSEWSAERFIQEGDILWNSTGTGTVGRACLVRASDLLPPKVVDTHVTIVRPNKKVVFPKYLFWWIRGPAVQRVIEGLATGTTNQVELSRATIRSVRFPLPPIAEQECIADKLDRLLAAVDACNARLDAIPAILKRFRQSVLGAAMRGELTAVWRQSSNSKRTTDKEILDTMFESWCAAKQREFKRKEKRLSKDWSKGFKVPRIDCTDLPPSWFSCPLGALAEVIDPNPSHRMPAYVQVGRPFVSSENILSSGELDFDVGKKITELEVQRQKCRYEVAIGTFAFSRIGTIGRSVFLPLPHTYGISHAMAVICPHGQIVKPKFLKLVMSSESLLSQARDGVQSVGVPDLGVGKMKDFVVSVPPLEEQEEIVRIVESYFNAASQLEEKVGVSLAEVRRISQSLLIQAFRGELVSQQSGAKSAARPPA